MRNREPLQLNGLFKLHNLGLTIISGVLLVLFLEQLIPTVFGHGILFAVCKYAGGWTDKLVVLYYVRPRSPPLFSHSHTNIHTPAQLPHKVPRTNRHSLPLPQEKAANLPTHLPPWRHCSPVLHSTFGPHIRLLGPYHSQPHCPRRDVLVLFSSSPRHSHLVETLYHDLTNRPVHHRPLLRLFRFVHVLYPHLLPIHAQQGQLRRRGVCRVRGYGHPKQLPPPLHQLLSRDVQDPGTEERPW